MESQSIRGRPDAGISCVRIMLVAALTSTPILAIKLAPPGPGQRRIDAGAHIEGLYRRRTSMRIKFSAGFEGSAIGTKLSALSIATLGVLRMPAESSAGRGFAISKLVLSLRFEIAGVMTLVQLIRELAPRAVDLAPTLHGGARADRVGPALDIGVFLDL